MDPDEPAILPQTRRTLVVDDLDGAPTQGIEPGRGFELVGKAGEGAMGEVLVATDRDLDRTVAFKVMSPELASHPHRVDRFYAEARITARLDHPGIVPIHGLARCDDGRLGYTMKLVRGRTLHDWLGEVARVRTAGSLPDPLRLAARLEVFLKVCEAVGYAHDQGVLHRDLKPENVMLGDHGEVYVMDWGLAAPLDSTDPAVGSGGGTPGFLAPEARDGERVLDVRVDVYALGVVLRELAGAERVPPDVAAIVARATAIRPDQRYPTVRALADDVRRFLHGLATDALPDDPWRAAVRWAGRHRVAMLVLLALSVLGGVAGVGWAQVARWRERTAALESERVLTELVGRYAAQAARIDARLVRYQGLGATFAAVAQERWQRGPSDSALYLLQDFQEPARAPPDLAPSPFYGQPISVAMPVLVVPAQEPALLAEAARLATLGPVARELMLVSAGPGESARDAIAVRGLSPAFVSVGLEDGVSFSYPGHAGFPPGYDARDRPWYTIARDASGPVWGDPYVDSAGLGLLLPCSFPLRDDGRTVGVASIKLPLGTLIGDLLAVDHGEAFLLDGRGRIVIRSSEPTDAAPALINAPAERPEFGVPEVVDGIRAGRPGSVVRDGDRLVVWNLLSDLGWAFVVEGDEQELRATVAR